MILGEVLKLYIAPAGTSGVRVAKEQLTLKESHGIIDDKFAGKKSDRSIMLVGEKAYDMARDNGIYLPKSALGENLLLNFDPNTLPCETTLTIGTATLEITKACTLCNHLTQYGAHLPKLLLNHRGVYAKVLKSGIVSVGDSVTLLQ